MSIKGDIFLGPLGSETKLSPFGRKFIVMVNETSRDERTANGTLKQDILYVKRSWDLKYSKISGEDLKVIEGVYDAYVDSIANLSLKVYTEDGVRDRYVVVMKPTKKTRDTLLDAGIWSSVNFRITEV